MKGTDWLCKLEWEKCGSRVGGGGGGGLKTVGRETLGDLVREIFVVFLFLEPFLKNHLSALLISLILHVLPLKNHFLIPHTALKKNEAKFS